MSLSKAQRAVVREMFGGCCAYCGQPLGERWHADHVRAVRRMIWHEMKEDGESRRVLVGIECPENEAIDNYFPACAPCNLHKSVYSLTEWRKKLGRQIEIAMKACGPLRQAYRFGLVHFSDAPIVFYFEKFKAAQPS